MLPAKWSHTQWQQLMTGTTIHHTFDLMVLPLQNQHAAFPGADLSCGVMQGGILAIDTAPDNEQLVATAGSDHAVHLLDRSTERVTANLVGHSKKVTGKPLSLPPLLAQLPASL